jgi:Aspartyl/Asparaginyl beta-hydroxylase/Nif11 domain
MPVGEEMISSFKLPFNFDPEDLKSDLQHIAPEDWTRHFNAQYYEGEWTGVSLRSVGGLVKQIYPDPRAKTPFADTPLLARCPNVRALLASFQCPLLAVRFLRLGVAARIREHRDFDLGYEEGQLRLHVPIVTNPDVDFFLDAHRVEMKEGECWYLDLSLPHWVENHGSTARIHLVIDCELNEWLRQILAASEPPDASFADSEGPSSPEALTRFRQAVLCDRDLQHRLRQTADRESFIRLVVAVGRKRGFHFAPADVEEALRLAQRRWLERWIG